LEIVILRGKNGRKKVNKVFLRFFSKKVYLYLLLMKIMLNIAELKSVSRRENGLKQQGVGSGLLPQTPKSE